MNVANGCFKEVSREDFYAAPFFVKELRVELRTIGRYPYTNEYVQNRVVLAMSVDYFADERYGWPVLTKYLIRE